MGTTSTRHRVLVVDDSATIRARIVASLRNYHCLEAANGLAGLAQLRTGRVDAVLVDLEMPVMDGVTFLRTVRADPDFQSLPVIVLTGVMAVEVVNQCRALGCAGFVLKPVDPEYLIAKLGRLLKDRDQAGTF
ncbi:MAG: response regulator [Myxococcaceae bacterium]